ncbi:putative uncharacterized GPI-anchored protein-lke [Helianthus annuus]|nr:putative uncharacterized GPI-anchored protein-lke [Helianthus annuus]
MFDQKVETSRICPLVFPNTKNVSKACGNTNNNRTTCCDALEHYITKLQDQSFITNLQAISCASSFAASLQKANVSINVYDICRVKLKDFSLQDSGCLFPSLPFDVTYDQSSGIDFKCDLNDNVAAPWPLSPHSSSNPSMSMCLCYFERLDRLVGPGTESNIGFVGWISFIYIYI